MKRKPILLILALILTLCSACGDTSYPTDPVNAAFILGVANNNTRINTAIDELSDLPAAAGSTYSIIVADGTPSEICGGEIPDLSDRGYTKDMLTRVQSSILADIAAKIDNATPDADQVDMASSLDLATRTLRANAVGGRDDFLIIYSSCISTTGLINMVKTPISKLDTENSVQAITDSMGVDLSGIQVIIYACGDVGGDQQSLSNNERTLLRDFYEQLLMMLGADSVEFREDLPLPTSYDFPQTVSCMATEETGSVLRELVVLTPETFTLTSTGVDESTPSTPLDDPIVIPESMIGFIGDKATYLDTAAAEATLQPIAEYLLEHENLRILLCGSCAGDEDTEHTILLSAARAETVRQSLIAQGVPEDRVIAVGLRLKDNPWHVYGVGCGEAGSVNRVTILLDASSEIAEQILLSVNRE